MVPSEYHLLTEFNYEATVLLDGSAPDRMILQDPMIASYVSEFGAKEGDLAWCACVDGLIVGAVWIRFIEAYGFVADDVPELALALYGPWRGRGIGTRLLGQFLGHLDVAGVERVSLSVIKTNPAQRLYRRMGFREVGETEDSYKMIRDRLVSTCS